MLDQTRPFRCYRLNVFPYTRHTVAMLSCTDWHGRTESDRRENTWDLAIPCAELHAVAPIQAFERILRELLDRLDPPLGDPWAKPPEPPDGGYRGDPETPAQPPLPLDIVGYTQSVGPLP